MSRMIRSLALTGIVLVAASIATGCRGGRALASGPDPGGPHSRISRDDVPRLGHGLVRYPRGLMPGVRHRREVTPGELGVRHRREVTPGESGVRRPARRGRALPPGCKRVAGGMQCVNSRGLDRDWKLGDRDGDGKGDRDGQDPIRSLIGPLD